MKKIMVLVGLGALLATACQAEQPKPVVPPVVLSTGGPSGCTGAIYGTVGVGQISVQLSEGATASLSTDSEGRYVFPRLSAGNYQVQITVPADYKALSPTIVEINLAKGCDVVEVSFELAAVNAPVSSVPAVVAPNNQAGFQLTNPLDEVGKKLAEARALFDEFKLELPLKELMFLPGGLISLMSPALACLQVFAYLSYLPYLWVLFRWLWRKESWREIVGPAAKWLWIIMLAGAPAVYLTSFHEVAKSFWWTENSFVSHALGWDLSSFSPDLNPESVTEALKHLIVLTTWHVNYEILLFGALLIVIPVACLTGNPKFLFAWGFAWVAFWLFGIAFWLDLTFVDAYRSTTVLGIGASFLRSTVTRLNDVFIGSTGNLAWAFTLAPLVFLFWLMFFHGRETAPEENRGRRVVNLNELQDWLNTILALLGIRLAFQNQAAWAGSPPGYPQLEDGSAPPARSPSNSPPPMRPIDSGDADSGSGKSKGTGANFNGAPKVGAANQPAGRGSAPKNLAVPASWIISRPKPAETAENADKPDADRPPATLSDPPRDFKIIGASEDMEDGGVGRISNLAPPRADEKAAPLTDEKVASAPTARAESDVVEEAVVLGASVPLARDADGAVPIPQEEPANSDVVAIATGTAPKARVGLARMTNDYVLASTTLRKGEPVLIIEVRGEKLLTDSGDMVPLNAVEFVGGEQ